MKQPEKITIGGNDKPTFLNALLGKQLKEKEPPGPIAPDAPIMQWVEQQRKIGLQREAQLLPEGATFDDLKKALWATLDAGLQNTDSQRSGSYEKGKNEQIKILLSIALAAIDPMKEQLAGQVRLPYLMEMMLQSAKIIVETKWPQETALLLMQKHANQEPEIAAKDQVLTFWKELVGVLARLPVQLDTATTQMKLIAERFSGSFTTALGPEGVPPGLKMSEIIRYLQLLALQRLAHAGQPEMLVGRDTWQSDGFHMQLKEGWIAFLQRLKNPKYRGLIARLEAGETVSSAEYPPKDFTLDFSAPPAPTGLEGLDDENPEADPFSTYLQELCDKWSELAKAGHPAIQNRLLPSDLPNRPTKLEKNQQAVLLFLEQLITLLSPAVDVAEAADAMMLHYADRALPNQFLQILVEQKRLATQAKAAELAKHRRGPQPEAEKTVQNDLKIALSSSVLLEDGMSQEKLLRLITYFLHSTPGQDPSRVTEEIVARVSTFFQEYLGALRTHLSNLPEGAQQPERVVLAFQKIGSDLKICCLLDGVPLTPVSLREGNIADIGRPHPRTEQVGKYRRHRPAASSDRAAIGFKHWKSHSA